MDHQTIASDLIGPLWRGIPEEWKRRYRRDVWTQFETRMRLSARAKTIGVFVERMSSYFGISIPSTDLKRFDAAVAEAQSQGRDVLRLIGRECSLITTMVRVEAQQRRDAKQALRESQEELF